MKSETEKIIYHYSDNDHSRFTNIEGGIRLAHNMLDASDISNKYIIFLSDGFPTTYLKENYHDTTSTGQLPGYEPYTPNARKSGEGQFYNTTTKEPCGGGTSYSDRAADYAEKAAAKAKNSGITIYSIGVGLGDQKVAKDSSGRYYFWSEKLGNNVSDIVDIGSDTEPKIGTGKTGYENWLKKKIGSDYYQDCQDTDGLKNVLNGIFTALEEQFEASIKDTWVTEDKMGEFAGLNDGIEFLGFYNKNGKIKDELNGGKDNKAVYDKDNRSISWDLQNSKVEQTQDGNSGTIYIYTSSNIASAWKMSLKHLSLRI